MESNEIAALGYAASFVAFVATAVLMGTRWRASEWFRPLISACVVSSIWGALLALYSLGYLASPGLLTAAEWLRYGAWLFVFFFVLASLGDRRNVTRNIRRFGVPFALLAFTGLTVFSLTRLTDPFAAVMVSGNIVASLMLVGFAEQVFRKLPGDSAQGFRYVCVMIFVVSLFDIGVFAQTLVLASVHDETWAARGYVGSLLTIPLLVYGQRSTDRSGAEFSRQFVLRSFFLLATSAGLALWLLATLVSEDVNSSAARVALVFLAVATIGGAATVAASATIRSRVRVFLTKALFRYKYDYRKEWLRFIGTLSESGPENVPTTSVRAVAQIVNSPGGIVWTRASDGDQYVPVGAWHTELPVGRSFARSSSLVRFLRYRQWVVDLNEMETYPARYQDLRLDDWVSQRSDFWLVVPMLLGTRLYGFIVLLKPRLMPPLNFEDHDLLRTVGRHAGTHIKQAELDKRLAESSQFGTYHRLSAFLMHDLNNLIAQQSMVVKNAEKFRDNPKFIDDTIDTIAHSVSRMRRLMGQLTSLTKTPKSSRVNLADVLGSAVETSMTREPRPELTVADDALIVTADADRLTLVFEHLIRNAQEATDSDGSVQIEARKEKDSAAIVITDTGCGMTPEFVSERLFRPFDSTKGSQSMGIGAYQAREYVDTLGGRLEVESVPGEGSTFKLLLPTVS